jgi:hypothetical protein
LVQIKLIAKDTNAIHTIITIRQLKLNEVMIGNYLQKKKHQAKQAWVFR